ncbi:histone H1-like [Gopherus flavomarginatus]|uniref:histone H1-like n=1 Tax=Gopherus flavomarginatus TaxID=286002 RepID=UPI0021CC336E|nr:histone H1-like [Gopherus flavomarginatus]
MSTAQTAPEAPAAAEAPVSQRKKKRRKKKPPRRQRPAFAQLILWSVDFSKSRKGFSLVAIEKELAATGVDVQRNKSRIKAALKKLVTNNILYKVPGVTEAPGSYKLCKEPGVGKTQLVLQLPKTKEAKKPAKQKRQADKKPPANKEAKKIKKGTRTKTSGKMRNVAEGKGAGKTFATSTARRAIAPQRKS